MFFGGDNLGAVVADIGTQNTRIGFAGEDAPRAFHPTAVGVTENASRSLTIPFTKPPLDLEVQSPVVDGLIVDFDLYQFLWEENLRSQLKTELKETPVFLAEKPFQPPATRYKLAELMFETFSTSAFFLSKDSVLSCYACGKTTGMAADLGQSGATICPVLEGFCELKALVRTPIGGNSLDDLLLRLLEKRLGQAPKPLYAFTKNLHAQQANALSHVLQPAELAIETTGLEGRVRPSYARYQTYALAREMREAIGKVSETPLFDYSLPTAFGYNNPLVDLNVDARYLNLPATAYELPDGTVVDVGLERFLLPEAYFEPALMFSADDLARQSCVGLPKALLGGLLQCEIDTHAALLNNIVLGGGLLLEGFPDRFKAALDLAVYSSLPSAKVRVFSQSSSDRVCGAWLGGSIAASLGSLHDLWVSRREYEEFGATVLDRKCP